MRTIKVDKNGAWVFDGGKPVYIEDRDKLAQDIDEIMSTEFSGLPQMVGHVYASPFEVSSLARRALRNALENLANLHKRHRGDRRTDSEKIGRIDYVSVTPARFVVPDSAQNGSRYIVTIRITTRDGVVRQLRQSVGSSIV